MLISFDMPPSSCLDGSKTGESAKCLWVGEVEGMAGKENREIVTPWGVLAIMAYTGRLCPKGVPFFTLKVDKRVGISQVEV